jgi:hypothetical protein
MNTTTPIDPETLEHIARKRAKAKMGWFRHATVYALVNAGLFLLATLSGHSWHMFPLLGWGLALLIHGLVVFALPSGDGLHARLLQKERERLQRPLP